MNKREIKFRAWNTTDHEMFPWEDDIIWDFYEEDLVFMLFTGFRDAHGTEIYEADIIKETFENGTSYVWPVEWSEPNGAWVNGRTTAGRELVADCLGRLEVIGNIYQNGDLLIAN